MLKNNKSYLSITGGSMKKIVFFIMILCLCGINQVYAQLSISSFKSDVSKVGTTSAPFLTIGVGGRANAMEEHLCLWLMM